MRTYLDNNVISAIAKDDTASQSQALDQLIEAKEQGKIELVTSEITLEEIKRYAGPARKPVERTFRLLAKVPVVRWDELVGMHIYIDQYTCINAPLIQNDSLYDALLKLGLEQTDAQHLFVAAKQGCAVFLTCDGGVLGRAKDIQKLCAVAVQQPSDLVASEGW